MSSPEVLDLDSLNRATLARQLLLQRSELDVAATLSQAIAGRAFIPA